MHVTIAIDTKLIGGPLGKSAVVAFNNTRLLSFTENELPLGGGLAYAIT